MARAKKPMTATALAAEEGSFLIHLFASDPACLMPRQPVEDRDADGAVMAIATAKQSDRQAAGRNVR